MASELHYQDHRTHLERMIEVALSAVDPAAAVRRSLVRRENEIVIADRRFSKETGRLFLIGAGKAALAMGRSVSEIVGERLHQGILISRRDSAREPSAEPERLSVNLKHYRGGHPVSDWTSVEATRAVIEMAGQMHEEDLVLCLISGGASALLTYPRLELAAWQALIEALLKSGCSITELNTVRQHLDRVKGGGLLRYLPPARCATLILSDVVGNPLEMIGSGPTVPVELNAGEATAILERYHIQSKLSPGQWRQVVNALRDAGRDGTPAGNDVFNFIIGDVSAAAEAACQMAQQLGFKARVPTTHLEGEAREVGRVAAALALDAAPGSCLIMGGETTVTVQGSGKGGRNQELALAAAAVISGKPGRVICSFATDGSDGPTDAAGAIATSGTWHHAEKMGLNPLFYLENNDAYTFFERVGGLLVTGQTGTNVNDLVFILNYGPE